MEAVAVDAPHLTRAEYDAIRKLVYQTCGINLGENKMQLVRARLGKKLRSGGFSSYAEFLEQVKTDTTGEALTALLDSISTNTTHLFREMHHFDFLTKLLKRWNTEKRWAKTDAARIWSAGCSSGEEPYSLAMVARDILGESGTPVKILATDISTPMLERAQRGTFEEDRIESVPESYRRRFLRKSNSGSGTACEAAPELKQMIRFARFNLMTPTFPFKHGFDVIFCRNVMIYFDRPTQQQLVERYAKSLRPGGFLMIGHSESLNSITHSLRYVEPTIYQK